MQGRCLVGSSQINGIVPPWIASLDRACPRLALPFGSQNRASPRSAMESGFPLLPV
jgi:hypothetical protein